MFEVLSDPHTVYIVIDESHCSLISIKSDQIGALL